MKICLFARYPEKGKVKTRLAVKCGDGQALYLYKKMIATVLESLSEFKEEFVVYYTGCEQNTAKGWLPDYQLQKQAEGDLGEKLTAAMDDGFHSEQEKLIFIGADCIDLSPEIIHTTKAYLDEVDVVLGPSSDGGYYLIAMRHNSPELFQEIDWGTEVVFEQTLTKIYESNLSYKLLPELVDIDHWEDLPKDWQEEVEKLNV